MLRRSSVLILLAIVIHALSTAAKTCPSDITKLAFTSALKADCKENKQNACWNSNNNYRSVDGTCNHIPTNKGSTDAVIDKIMRPTYDDGWSTPRQHGVGGELLPSARAISVNIFTDRIVWALYTLLTFQWGQWIAHDIVSTTTSPGASCCGPNGTFPPVERPKNCFPIALPPNEPSFPGTCLSFVRSEAANCSNSCQIGFRVNTNAVTVFIDNSQIYGSDPEVAKSIRENGTPLLRTSPGDFPPKSNATCNKPNPGDFCFLAGDGRSDQQPFLSGMHIFWIREHNRIATTLQQLNSSLSDEEAFQIAKKIINGMHQSITYNDYLPIILGDEGVRRWKLLSKSGRSSYNYNVNPRLVQEFATAAFRFGHSQILGKILVGKEFILLRYMFNNPSLNRDHFQDIIAALINSNQSAQVVDNVFSQEITRNLFFNNQTGRGGDLLSTNIQRGRDHGLPTYAQVREFCCLPPITGFNDTEALGAEGYKLGALYKLWMKDDLLAATKATHQSTHANHFEIKLRSLQPSVLVARSVDDIDLYVGMLHETVKSGLLGPTFQCLVGLQFYILKYGDRFFFDNDQWHFTESQLNAIRSVKLGEIICRHTNFTEVQANVFEPISPTNAAVPCASLIKNGLDLTLFKKPNYGASILDLLKITL